MNVDIKIVLRALSPKIIMKVIQTFDRATMVVVGSCWAAVVVMMAFAIYTTTLSVAEKHANDAAIAAEPNLPKIVRKSIEPRYAQSMTDRLKRLYPQISTSFEHGALSLSASDGSRFHQWLIALSYVDTMSSEYHWTLQRFCVGQCGGADLMQAVLAGEQVSFEMPQ
jgi:hypothetical protein